MLLDSAEVDLCTYTLLIYCKFKSTNYNKHGNAVRIIRERVWSLHSDKPPSFNINI